MRKIAILGTGTSLRHAPFGDETFEFWGSAELWGRVPRLDRAFLFYDEAKSRADGTWDQIQAVTVPLYLQRARADLPTSLTYPLDEVTDAFTVDGRVSPFLTNTVSYMLALMLLEQSKPTWVHLFGVDVVHDTEYAQQRPSIEFFLGVCVGRGIRVVVPAVSDLLKTQYLYGYDETARAAQCRDLDERALWFHIQHDQTIQQIQALLTRLVHVRAVRADTKLHMARATL